jgi:putative ABC transport system permease protein
LNREGKTMKSYSEITNRYMMENKKRTALTIIGITLATVLIFAVGTFLLSFRDSFVKSTRADGDYEFQIMDINKDQLDKVINNTEVKDSSIYSLGKVYSINGSERTVNIAEGNEEFFKKIENTEILEGKEPDKIGEVIIDSNGKNLLNVKLEDEIKLTGSNGEFKVKVVGIYKAGTYSTDGYLNFITYLDDTAFDKENKYTAFINLESKKDKQEIIDNVMKNADIEINEKTKGENINLLYLTGNGSDVGMSKALKYMAIFVVLIIIICTITVIYNSFNISVMERIKYFGILKAIGATPNQIKKIIFKEGAIMGLIALPAGCIVGFLALKYGIKIFIGDDLLIVLKDFEVSFYPSIILVTVILVSITIWLSILGPARKAKKVSAIEAMRNQNEIKIGKVKRRRGKFVEKVFGIEGSLAYKNIRRTPFRFIVTVLALTISIILFNVFYAFLDYAKQSVAQLYMNVAFDSQLTKTIEGEEFSSDEINDVHKNISAKENYECYFNYSNIAFPKDKVNGEYESRVNNPVGTNELDDIEYRKVPHITTYIEGEKELKLAEQYLVEGKIDMNDLKSGGVIIVDSRKTINEDGSKKIIRATNYKVGDKIKIPKLNNYKEESEDVSIDKFRTAINNNEFIEVKVVAIVEKDPFVGDYIDGEIELIFHEEGTTQLFGQVNLNSLLFNFGDDENSREEAIKYIDGVKDANSYSYFDIGDELKMMDEIYSQVEFFVYCFIFIITVISAVNIFNTISTNLLLRRREFSTLKAIGMTEKQLKKSVMLEGTLYGIFAAFFGGITTAILLVVIIKISGGLADLEYKFAVIPFASSIIASIALTYISTIIPLRKLRDLSIVEGICDDE